MYHELRPYFQSRRPVIWLVTREEERAEKTIVDIVKNLTETSSSKPCLVTSWTLTGGWIRPRHSKNVNYEFLSGDKEPSAAVKHFINKSPKFNQINVAIIRNAQLFTNEPHFISALQDAAYSLSFTKGTLVCISSSYRVPDYIKNVATVITPGPPDEETLTSLVNSVLQNLQSNKDAWDKKKGRALKQIRITNSISNSRQDLVNALKGLTVSEAKNLISYSFATQQTDINVELIAEKKAESLSNVPGLKIERKVYNLDDVGGLDNIKAWVRKRRRVFSKEAKDFGLDPCKGFVALGVPGCGKTYIARCIATELGLPLVSLALAELKGSYVGETEGNMRTALQCIDAMGQLCLLVDEGEKGVPGSSGGANDGGASSGMLQILLKWMQDREGDVFAIITANDISAIPPEMLRKGRLDEIFFFDMPSSIEEIAEIINIHTQRRGRKFHMEDIKEIASHLITEEGSFTGAEIEVAVNEGLLTAFNDERDLELEDIKQAALSSVPMYKTMREKIRTLRNWCKHRAVPASSTSNFFKTASFKNKSPII